MQTQDQDILFTGGIGDLISVVSFMPIEYRQRIKTIYWAAFRGNALQPLLKSLPDFKKSTHIFLKEDFADKRALYDKQEVERACNLKLDQVEDWSIKTKFPEIARGDWTYQGCPFLTTRLSKLAPKKALPDHYVVIQGATSQNEAAHQEIRNLQPFEWRAITRDLAKQGLYGVVLDVPGDPLPVQSDRLLDARGLALGQSIEVLKDPRCEGYWGIDSFLAVLATRRFADPSRLKVRAKNPHYRKWKAIYAAPYSYFPFLTSEIR